MIEGGNIPDTFAAVWGMDRRGAMRYTGALESVIWKSRGVWWPVSGKSVEMVDQRI